MLLLDALLGTLHPNVYKISDLVKAEAEASTRLCAQVLHQMEIPTAIIQLVQTEFSDSFQKVFVIPLLVQWNHLPLLVQTLITGEFRANEVETTGGFKENPKPLPHQDNYTKHLTP